MIAPPQPAVPPWLRRADGLRLVVLGADGFIGGRVTLLALAAGADVTAICVGEPWRLAEIAASPGLRLVRASGASWWDPALDRELDGSDALVLLAYTPPPAPPDARHEHEVNAAGAIRVGRTALERGVRVVFASSADVYGPWHPQLVGESLLPRPARPYAEAKLAVEQELDVVSLRIATAYGAGETVPRAIPSFIRALSANEPALVHGDGRDVHDYVHVDEVAAAFVNAAATPLRTAVLNVGSGVGRTTREVLAAVARALDVEPRARYELSSRPSSRLVLDPSAARRALDFEPSRDFDAAVGEEAEWLRAAME